MRLRFDRMGWMRLSAAVAGILFLSLAAACWHELSERRAPPSAVEMMIPKGASVRTIARLLAERGIIASPLLFRVAARLRGDAARLRHGYYRFAEPASMLEVLDRLVRGDVMRFSVTVPEGLRTEEVLALLAERTGVPLSRWRAAMRELAGQEIEGRLLPETYDYTLPLSPKALLERMMKAQRAVLESLSPDRRQWRRLVIIASIIEKETGIDRERPLVSAVIHNRLKKRMRLQMDPTVIYGILRTEGGFSGNLRRRDLRTDTPWNTYTRYGLPPTPICNPGRASLEAAAHPADVDYLYFVADGTGGHVFASTRAEHERNVRAWVNIERRRSRGGSP